MNVGGDFSGGDFHWWRYFSRGGDFSSGDFGWWRDAWIPTVPMHFDCKHYYLLAQDETKSKMSFLKSAICRDDLY